jgi:hypothetical protein
MPEPRTAQAREERLLKGIQQAYKALAAEIDASEDQDAIQAIHARLRDYNLAEISRLGYWEHRALNAERDLRMALGAVRRGRSAHRC